MRFDLKGFRTKYGLKQIEVAQMFNCVQGNVSSIETGKRELEDYQVQIILEKYGENVLTEFSVPDNTNLALSDNRGISVAGDRNHVNGELDRLVDVIGRQSAQLSKSQEQIDRLLTLLEKK